MKTVVLDDDPTGSQSATGVEVLLSWSADRIESALREADSVYILTNTRALEEFAAVAVLTEIRDQCDEVSLRLEEPVRFVLRGDSTLRGHVFAETEVFANETTLIAFVPAFPDGGRTTVDAQHLVVQHGTAVPAHKTEYASDPVFPFDTSDLRDYVAQRSARPVVHLNRAAVRGSVVSAVDRLRAAAQGSVVVFDCESQNDVRAIARILQGVSDAGSTVTVRCAAPLAAEIAGVTSSGLLSTPLFDGPVPTLVVCGSHTRGALDQLAPVAAQWGEPTVIVTADALSDPDSVGEAIGETVAARLQNDGFGFITTERKRSSEHNTLAHGELVMRALTGAVRVATPHARAVVSKGGITSAEVASVGIGADSARVRGQIQPGVSVWDLRARDGHEVTYIVVPGNVGDPHTIMAALEALAFVGPQANGTQQ